MMEWLFAIRVATNGSDWARPRQYPNTPARLLAVKIIEAI
jgi:hypothetical protein